MRFFDDEEKDHETALNVAVISCSLRNKGHDRFGCKVDIFRSWCNTCG